VILRRVIDASAEIEALTAVQDRQPGTDAERRAANHLRRRLSHLGREARTEPILVWPRWHLTYLLHAVLAVVGSAISVKNALIGTILVAIAAISAIGDLTGRLFLVRRLTGRRASQNVISTEQNGRPGTLILTAHYDTGRGGAVFKRLANRGISPAQPFVAAIVLLVVTSVARLAGLDNNVLAIVQFVPTAALIVSVPYLADIALSGSVPGANDNASGVATVLRLAERYQGDLDNLDVWVLLPGAQEAGALGTRAWLRQHRRTLNSRATVVLNVDEVGAGTVRYAAREGPLIPLRPHKQLLELCRQLEREDEEERRYGVEAAPVRRPTDAYAARARRLPAVTISCAPAPHHHQPTDTPDNVDPEALERAFGFCSELIELIDEEIGPGIAEITAAAGTADRTKASFTPS
jgi:Peptidase family M28